VARLALISLTEVGVYASASIVSVGSGIVLSAQTLLDPQNAWVPLGVLVTLLGIAVATTIKVVRLIDSIHREIAIAKKERGKLARAAGVDLNGGAT